MVLLLIASLVCINVGLYFAFRKYVRKTISRYEDKAAGVQTEIDVILSANKGVGKQFRMLEQRVRELGERQDQLEWDESSGFSFKQAVELAKQGVNADELVSSCKISKGEAELLTLIHRLDKVN